MVLIFKWAISCGICQFCLPDSRILCLIDCGSATDANNDLALHVKEREREEVAIINNMQCKQINLQVSLFCGCQVKAFCFKRNENSRQI